MITAIRTRNYRNTRNYSSCIRLVLVLIFAAVGLSTIPLSVTAQIVSNLSETTDNQYEVGNTFNPFGMTNADAGIAAAFTTGSNDGGYSLTSATISFRFDQAGSPANIQVTVNNDSSGDPGTSLGTLTGSNPTTAGEHAFSNAGIALAANTTYLLTLLAPGSPTGSDNYYRPANTTSDSETTSDGWSIANEARVTVNGATSWFSLGRTMQFSLEATAVPEPHEYALLMGLGLVGFVAVRRRWQVSQST